MRRRTVAIVVAALVAASVYAASAFGATYSTIYWNGPSTGNHWKLSAGFNNRTAAWVFIPSGPCLPANAQLEVAYFLDGGGGNLVRLNGIRSPFGACSLLYIEDSAGFPAKVGCRIIEQGSGGTVTRPLQCWSQWNT